MNRNLRKKLLQPEEETELWTSFKEDGSIKSRNRIVEAYMPLAMSMASKFARLRPEAAEDIEAQAYVGIIDAADRFDPSKGFAFASFAKSHIRNQITRQYHADIRSVHVTSTDENRSIMNNLGRATAAAERNLNRQGIESSENVLTEEIARLLGVTSEAVMAVKNASPSAHVRLDASAGGSNDGDASTIGEILDIDVGSENFEDIEYKEKLAQYVRQCVGRLNHRERYTVARRTLCHEEDRTSYKDISDHLGVSAERARQIHVTAIQKIARRVSREMRGRGLSSGFLPLENGTFNSERLEHLLRDNFFVDARQSDMLSKIDDGGVHFQSIQSIGEIFHNTRSETGLCDDDLITISAFLEDCASSLDRKTRAVSKARILDCSEEAPDILDCSATLRMPFERVALLESKAQAVLAHIVSTRISRGDYGPEVGAIVSQAQPLLESVLGMTIHQSELDHSGQNRQGVDLEASEESGTSSAPEQITMGF